ncbi:BREX system P-loop protein BrxC [Peijinzhouia sedimentorum]
MIIKDIFEKDIDRTIETVIKADDEANISNEVVEYVITNEIKNKIRGFFSAYNDYTVANGVWISGFFGSGKSHLLKILSFVLENKAVDDYHVGELFSENIEKDDILKGDVLKSTRIPSESILFNIDQQAQITSKTDANAILSVFYKVFYDHLGLYGYQPHVAEFELWLQRNNQLEDFTSRFNSKSDKVWKEARIDYYDPLVTDTIAEVLAEINGKKAESYEDILDEIEDRNKQSIEHFCERVLEYIESKGPHFRLNFFVDEVGQYISDNTRLMLNLQTIAETLATKTKGRSWVLVTSQEDMEKILGDMTKSQQSDFSRIQDRFAIKIPLTSANVDEVIEKRLLKKKETAEPTLAELYEIEKTHLGTLISFSDAGVQFKGFKGSDDFVRKYPFLPYQFDLFQQCRRALSSHNAFQGKHASVGERSMLSVFQQVIKKVSEKKGKALVSFDLMFEGIRSELRGEIQSSIQLAENNLSDLFAIQVLKTLFMIKYYGSFKATKRNISVLLIDHLDIDIKAHEDKVEKALNILENQNYIQRNSDFYEFMTNEEKDVETEIKDMDIDDSAVTLQLKELFFDEIIKDNKIQFTDNKQHYDFMPIIDDATVGREKELGIEIITERNPIYKETLSLQSQTMGTTVMRMVLPPNPVFIKDLNTFLKTNKYVKQSQTSTLKAERRRILHERQVQNGERRRNLITLASKLLSESDVYINGSKQELNPTTDGRARVHVAFQILVKNVYPNLRMLGHTTYTESSINEILLSTQAELFKIEQTITEAESEILNQINRRKARSERTSLGELKDVLGRRPYGWYPNAVWANVAKLYRRGQIELKQDSNLLDTTEASRALINSSHHHNTLAQVQEPEDPSKVRALKELYSEFFDQSSGLSLGKDIASDFKEKLKITRSEIDDLLRQKGSYPFLVSLEETREQIHNLISKDYSHILREVKNYEDLLLDFKEDALDPVRRFMNSGQKSIYDGIRTTATGDTSNFHYVDSEELKVLQDVLNHPKPYFGNLLQEAKHAMDTLSEKVIQKIDVERKATLQCIEDAISTLTNNENFEELDSLQQQAILSPFKQEKSKVDTQRFISSLREIGRRVNDELLVSQLTELHRLANKVRESDGGKVAEPTVHYIKANNLKVPFEQRELRTEEDVDAYLEKMREVFKKQIKENRRISL